MYETMVVVGDDEHRRRSRRSSVTYAEIWRAADKVVFSTTLESVASERTRIERSGEPATIRALKEASAQDLSIGGPGLAAEAIRARLVDEIHLFVHPIIVGGGKAGAARRRSRSRLSCSMNAGSPAASCISTTG